MINDANPIKQKKTSVLVVEDDKFLQKILIMKFAAEGFDVRGASDGEEAIRMALAEPRPELIVLDLILPKKNGFEVLAELRTDAQGKNVPVVVLSNLGQDEDIRRARDLGAIDFHVKSNLSIQEVVQKVRESFARFLAEKGKKT
ncbi:MAG: response regulator [Patescibacteria group bacterium]|nr:response regulator [Patescibacteria group bacterium]